MNKLTLKSRLPLILAVGVPVVFLLGVMLVAWVPSLLARPQHDFVYYSAQEYATLSGAYMVEDGSLKRTCSQASDDLDSWIPEKVTPNGSTLGQSKAIYLAPDTDCEAIYKRFTFYRYDVKAKKSIKLTEQQALALNILDERISPDGYTLERGEYSGPWFGSGYGSGNSYHLKGNGAVVELGELQATRDRYSSDIFVGWVQ